MQFIRVGVMSGVLVSYGKAGKEDSLSVLQRAGVGMTHQAVAKSGSQLEATKKLQQTLGDTIMQSITNSDPEAMNRISGDFMKVLSDQMKAIKPAVSAENSELQTALSDASNEVAKCNAAMQISFTSGDTSVNYQNWKVHDLREDHIRCRTQEVAAVDDADTECKSAQNISQAAILNQPDCACADNFDIDSSDRKRALSCMGTTDLWIQEDFEALESASALCDTKEQTKHSKSVGCERNQSNFESTWCTYSTKLATVCDTLATCHANALTEYNRIEAGGKLQEVSHKELWTAVTRVDCLIKLFGKAKTENLKENDVNGCLNVNVDTSDLDIHYPGVDSKEPCDTSTTVWNSTEYTAVEAFQELLDRYTKMNKPHIRPLADCVKDQITPCTPDPDGTHCLQLEEEGVWDSRDLAKFFLCLAENCIDQTKMFGRTCKEVVEEGSCDMDLGKNFGKVAFVCPRLCQDACKQC